ncbi:signal peptide peptidase SppA [Marinagarivorans algicola]|uniref:signal peptide peptidase SppA n=1 Tax=Marinagarivorans algicola TaxID=1513270 RepID=UPI0006B55099|nr:signal peptide peptidase SppA [Marinagarivorans algicola]
MSSSKSNIVVRLWRFIWGTVSWLRIALLNLLFIGLLVIFISAALESAPKPIEKAGPLLIAPAGTLVDQLSYEPPLASLTGNNKPAETELRSLIEAINQATFDPRVTALIMKLDDLGSAGVSKLQELGQAIEAFKANDKPVIAYSNMLNQQQYYLASYANTIHIHDMGGVAITGFGLYRNYFKGLIDKLGVNVHVFKSGTFKDFVEPYIRNDMSEPSRAHNTQWIESLWATYSHDIEQRRHLEAGSLDQYIKNLPQLLNDNQGSTAQLAKAYNLVDKIGSKQELIDYLRTEFGPHKNNKHAFNSISLFDYQQELAFKKMQQKGNIGLIVATGTITDGEQPEGSIGGDTLSSLIREARHNDDLKALVLRIDSGGGSAFASELIRQEIIATRAAGKPVVVSMGSVAASGGYWIATAADQIFATPTTITGSIGVFSIIPTFEQTLDKVGITSDAVATSELAGLFQLSRPMSAEAKHVFQLGVESVYQKFLTLTAEARKSNIEDIQKVAEGRVWLGQKAQTLNLIDQTGYLSDAIAQAAQLAGVTTAHVKLIERTLSPAEQIMKRLMLNTQVQSVAANLVPTSPSRSLIHSAQAAFDDQALTTLMAQQLKVQARNPQAPPAPVALCVQCVAY